MIYCRDKIVQIFCIFILLITSDIFAEASLFVYYPLPARSKTVESRLNSELPDVNVTVFGRYADFITKIKSDRPAAILVKKELLSSVTGYKAAFSGERKGKIDEKYLYMFTNKEFLNMSIDTATIGVVDILGKQNMNRYLDSVFDAELTIKRVRKVNDIMPLLLFDMASIALVPESNLEYYKSNSNIELYTKETEITMSIGVVAVRDDDAKVIIAKALTNLSEKTKTLLGVDKWR